MFDKVVIADRGEVVLRIARTCERMGVTSVAVHTRTEAGAPHATACDEAVEIGEGAHAYADVDAIIAAARSVGAQAIHPGYGPFGRDPGAVRAITGAGLVPIAAPAEVIERVAHPLPARELSRFAGVRPLPSSALELASIEQVAEQALDVGYPLRAVAFAGRSVAELADSENDLHAAIERCRARAREAFGDDRLYLERWIERPRILSALLVGDGRDFVALGDLELSLEHEARTLLAESPAPALASLPGAKRQTLCDGALRVARDAGLSGAAAAEFLLDAQNQLFFTRLRPGLPVAHALAEMCANIDLVEVQLRIAAGEGLPEEARRAQPTGHAAEARIYAQPSNGSAETGSIPISALRWPMVAPGSLRVETDLAVGSHATITLDPLVAKVTAYGQTRHQALLTLDRVLAEAIIEPLATNLPFVRRILAEESYRAGQYDNGFAAQLLSE